MKSIQEIAAEGQSIQDEGSQIVSALSDILAKAQDLMDRASALNADVAAIASASPAPAHEVKDVIIENTDGTSETLVPESSVA